MNADIDRYIKEIVRILVPLNTDRVILFGSAARNDMHIDSDLDLVVVLDEDRIPQSYEEKLYMRVAIKRALKSVNEQVAIDVIVYTKTEYMEMIKNRGSFLKEIAETGKVLYEKTSQGVA